MNDYELRIVFDLLAVEEGGIVRPLVSPVRSLHLVPAENDVLTGTPYDSIAALIFLDSVSEVAAGETSVEGHVAFPGGDLIRRFVGPGDKVDLRTVSRLVGKGILGAEVTRPPCELEFP